MNLNFTQRRGVRRDAFFVFFAIFASLRETDWVIYEGN